MEVAEIVCSDSADIYRCAAAKRSNTRGNECLKKPNEPPLQPPSAAKLQEIGLLVLCKKKKKRKGCFEEVFGKS